jgi:hypothetical protein
MGEILHLMRAQEEKQVRGTDPGEWRRGSPCNSLAKYDKGVRSLFIVSSAEGDTLWEAFFAAKVERRGVPVTELKEGLLAHVNSRYIKTGRLFHLFWHRCAARLGRPL